jgi:hypothetical protein
MNRVAVFKKYFYLHTVQNLYVFIFTKSKVRNICNYVKSQAHIFTQHLTRFVIKIKTHTQKPALLCSSYRLG